MSERVQAQGPAQTRPRSPPPPSPSPHPLGKIHLPNRPGICALLATSTKTSLSEPRRQHLSPELCAQHLGQRPKSERRWPLPRAGPGSCLTQRGARVLSATTRPSRICPQCPLSALPSHLLPWLTVLQPEAWLFLPSSRPLPQVSTGSSPRPSPNVCANVTHLLEDTLTSPYLQSCSREPPSCTRHASPSICVSCPL